MLNTGEHINTYDKNSYQAYYLPDNGEDISLATVTFLNDTFDEVEFCVKSKKDGFIYNWLVLYPNETYKKEYMINNG